MSLAGTVILVVLGVALIGFGAFILLRHADRPGGTIKWLGLEVSSSGAGLPLIAIGVASIALAVVAGQRATADTRSPASTSAPSEESSPAGRDSAAASAGDCLDRSLASVPKDRIAIDVESGMRDLDFIRGEQGLNQPFGIIFTEAAHRVGAVRMRRYQTGNSGGDLYKIEMLWDAGCRPIEPLRNVSRGGNPRELLNWDTVAVRFGASEYHLRIGGEGTIGVNSFTRVQ